MSMDDFNIFIILTIITGIFVLFFSAYVVIERKRKKAAGCFLILSAVNFMVSLTTFLMLAPTGQRIAYISSQVLAVSLFLAPVALMCYTISILDTELSKVKGFIRLLLYSPAVIISVVVLSTRSIGITMSLYGYMLYSPNLMMLDIFYHITLHLIIIAIIAYEIRRNKRSGKESRPAYVLLSGVIFYFVVSLVYYSLHVTGFYEKLPIQSLDLFVLYIFAATAMAMVQRKKT